MDLLLDTHVLLWWDSRNASLNPHAAQLIADPAHQIFVSAASIWEIAIKRRLGKLAFTGSAADAIGRNGFFALPILPLDAEQAGDLDWSHNDPFDRLLLVQSRRINAALVTADATIRQFTQAITLWAGA